MKLENLNKKKIKELYKNFVQNFYKKKAYFIETIFKSNVINGIYILYTNFIQDLKEIFFFWLSYFKYFFIKGYRFWKFLELVFFLSFPFVHFCLIGLFIYKYIFKYVFLIIDILILYILMDIKNLFEVILQKIIDRIILVYDKKYIPILQKRYSDTYNFLFNNKYIFFLSQLISLYLTFKKYIFFVLWDPVFVYVPLWIKKFKKYQKAYFSFHYLWYLIIITQNRIDSYLYKKWTNTEKKMPLYRYKFRKFKRMPGIKLRQIRDDWEFLKPHITTKLGWKLYLGICRVTIPMDIRYYKAVFKLYFLEIFWFLWDPIYFKYLFHRIEHLYYRFKLLYCSRLNIWIYIHSFKLFLVLFYNYFLYFFNKLLILLKWIYNFCKKLIKGIIWVPCAILKEFKEHQTIIWYWLVFFTKLYWNILWNNILSSKLIFFFKKKLNKKNKKNTKNTKTQ